MKRRYILLLILFLAIGFASISTTLVITGVIGIGTKNNDFKVIFTGAILDGIDKSNILISDDKIRIDYETEKLWKINDTSVLEFEVTNTSTQYDANVVLECDEITHEAIDFSITPSTMEIKPNEVRTGSITIKLNRAVYTENIKIDFSCRLKATAGEKTKAEVIEEINNLYNVSGNLQRSDGTSINNAELVVYSEKKLTKTDYQSGYFFVSGLERGFHHIYKVPSELTEYEEKDIKDYLIAEISTNGYLKVYDDNYKIVNYESSQDLEDIGVYCPYEIGDEIDFPYNGTDGSDGTIYEYEVKCSGKYKLEVWGAQGGSGASRIGGYGGYAVGEVSLSFEDMLYIAVGGKGLNTNSSNTLVKGGFNGGGIARHGSADNYHGSGGGATHIATVSGLLSELIDYRDTNNKYSTERYYSSNEILIVAGGGGGGGYYSGNEYSDGASGGGYVGVNCNGYNNGGAASTNGLGGSQTAGGGGAVTGSFGKGADYSTTAGSYYGAGGGGGFFGGGSSYNNFGGGGGSGYIASPKLTNKAMYCYGCSPSNNELSMTYRVNSATEDAESGIAKKNHGHARITLISY